MRLHLILPNDLPQPELDELRHLPLFFLAGPIRGGGDWQKRATEKLGVATAASGGCIVVNPSRYKEAHPHQRYRMQNGSSLGMVHFPHQTAWERYFMALAADGWPLGCLVFWLPTESVSQPRGDGQPYARDTYGELGEWRGRLLFNKTLRVAVAAEEAFPGLSVIKKNFAEAVGVDFKIFPDIDSLVRNAVQRASPESSFKTRVTL